MKKMRAGFERGKFDKEAKEREGEREKEKEKRDG